MLQQAPGPATNIPHPTEQNGWQGEGVSIRFPTDMIPIGIGDCWTIFEETNLAFSQLDVLVVRVRHQGGPCGISRAVVFDRRVLSSEL